MIQCEVIFQYHTTLDECEKIIGIYNFQEIPRVGDIIYIRGGGRYTVKQIMHMFSDNSFAEYKVIVYVK